MNGDGNFKMKCIGTGNISYTRNKLYEVVNGHWVDDDGDSMGSDKIKTIVDVNKWSCGVWELVEDEVSEPVKEKSLLEAVMKHLGVEEGEEFNIILDNGKLSKNNPFVFRNQKLEDKEGYFFKDYLGCLIIGEYKIEKLKWKPKHREKVWTVYSDENKNRWCNYFSFQENSLSCIALYKMGWLFRTEEEAKANQERVLAEMREVMEDE